MEIAKPNNPVEKKQNNKGFVMSNIVNSTPNAKPAIPTPT